MFGGVAVGSEGNGQAELTGKAQDARPGVDLAAGLARTGDGYLHSHACVAHGGEGFADELHAAGKVEPAVEIVHGEDLHEVGMGHDVEEARFGHLLHGAVVMLVVAALLLEGKHVPVVGGGVEAPFAKEMDACDEVIVLVGRDHLPDVVQLVFQPVGFEAEKHGNAAPGLFGLQPAHLVEVFLEGGGKVFAVFHGVIVAKGTRGMFGKAVDDKALGLTGFEHFAYGVAGVGVIGVGMEIDAYHGLFLAWVMAGPEKAEGRVYGRI